MNKKEIIVNKENKEIYVNGERVEVFAKKTKYVSGFVDKHYSIKAIDPVEVDGRYAGYGKKEKVVVDKAVARLYRYDNSTKTAIYFAPEVREDGTIFVTFDDKFIEDYHRNSHYYYEVKDVVIEDFEEKLGAFNNVVRTAFTWSIVIDKGLDNANPDAMEKKAKIWERVVEFCKNEDNKIFDEYGNFAKNAYEIIKANKEAFCEGII